MLHRFLIACVIILVAFNVTAQKLTTTQVQQLVNSKLYTFEAQTINTQTGGARHLNTEYFLKISGDTLISSLPYFGRAYSAPINAEDAGYDFTTTQFDYAVSTRKKDRYLVSIKTKNRIANTDFELAIYYNGNAYLNVINTDRQPISFTGYIK